MCSANADTCDFLALSVITFSSSDKCQYLHSLTPWKDDLLSQLLHCEPGGNLNAHIAIFSESLLSSNTGSMKEKHGSHISRGATGQWHGRSAVKPPGQWEQGSSMQRWIQRAAGSSLPLRGQQGSTSRGWWGRSWHLMDRLCVFSCEGHSPNMGNFQLLSSHCTEIIRWPPRGPKKTFKGRKEKSSCCWPTGYIYSGGVNMLLWTGLCQQQDVWQSQRHISGTETLGHSSASYLFINVEERWAGPWSSR